MKKQLTLIAIVLSILNACSSLPNEPSAQAIGSWQSIGNIHNNNINVAYDSGSVKKSGAVASLRDRKIVDDMSKENYINLPEYKTAIAEWEFHCINKTYQIKKAEFWDKNGQSLGTQTYTGNLYVAPASIVNNTPTERLFKIAGK